MVDKKKFRKQCLRYRQQLTSEKYQKHSGQIIANLLKEVNLDKYDTIHCYAAITKNREVNTFPLLKNLIDDGKRVVLPVSDFEHVEMNNILLHSVNELQENNWGIPEPKSGPEVEDSTIDLAIIPMVGADKNCNRIGYGRGFYDRFLKNFNAPKVGLCYRQCVISEVLNTNYHDVPLDMVVTEKSTIIRSSGRH